MEQQRVSPFDQANTWQFYQAEGDRQWQLATRASLEQNIHKHWQDAKYKYSQALGALPSGVVLEKVIIYRKLATVLRKQGHIAEAKSRYLDEGQKLIDEIADQPDNSTLRAVEEALYRLEYAHCDFDEQNWNELKYQIKALLKQFEREKYRRLHPDMLYVLGCAYDLLAIALERSDDLDKKDSLACWEIACGYLMQANDEKSTNILRNIDLNRAAQLVDSGDCDLAIPVLEGILADEKATARQRITAQQTLAASYLDRLAVDDIDRAHTLACENLDWSRKQKNVQEWVNALQLYSGVMKTVIEVVSPDDTRTLVEKVEKEYNAFRQFAKLDKTDLDEVELHRLLVEIYLAADNLSKAKNEVEFIETHRQKDEDRDEGDIYLTLARFHHKKGELSEAQVHLKEARLRFQRTKHWGVVVETDLQQVEVEVSQGKLEGAQKRLEETLKIANGLNCKTRIERVSARLQTLQKEHTMSNAMVQPSEQTVIKILFLMSEPSDLTRLRSGEEFREIEEQLQLAKLRDRFVLHAKMSVRAKDITRALLELQPQIVHFSGHGAENGGIYLEDIVSEAQLMPPDALTDLFKRFAIHLKCVVLNACYTEHQAQAIAKHIPYVIGMSHAIEDKASIAFSVGFYQAIGAGCTIEDAFKLGRTQIELQGISGNLMPVFIHGSQ